MSVKAIHNTLIPAIEAYCNVPIIRADQMGDKPSGAHAAYKITSPYIKGVGQPDRIMVPGELTMQDKSIESYKIVVSMTAYDMDDDTSMELAQSMYDWFAFHGEETLETAGVVVAEQTGVTNRDAFLVNDYERRNGFDVTLRVRRELVKETPFFDSIG